MGRRVKVLSVLLSILSVGLVGWQFLVNNIQGRPISVTAPTNGQVLIFDTSTTPGQWKPGAGSGGGIITDISGSNGILANGTSGVPQSGPSITLAPSYAGTASSLGTVQTPGVANTFSRGDHAHPAPLAGVNSVAGSATQSLIINGAGGNTIAGSTVAGVTTITVTGPTGPVTGSAVGLGAANSAGTGTALALATHVHKGLIGQYNAADLDSTNGNTVINLVGAGAVASSSFGKYTIQVPADLGKTRIAAVSYIFPPGGFPTLTAGAPTVSQVLINPGSGPGGAPIAAFTTQVAASQLAGQRVCGYVATTFATKSSAAVKAEIDLYYTFYPTLDGIFFDEVVAGNLAYYLDLYHYVHQKGGQGFVILNPGTNTDEGYINACDLLLSEENTLAGYLAFVPSAWTYKYSPSKFWHVIHDCPPASYASTIALAKSRNAGYVYVTDDGADGNPYDSAPTNFTNELQNVIGIAGPTLADATVAATGSSIVAAASDHQHVAPSVGVNGTAGSPTTSLILNGSGITVTSALSAGTTNVTFTAGAAGATSNVSISDEGTLVKANAANLDFVGGGVNAAGAGTTQTITVSASQSDGDFRALRVVGVTNTVTITADAIVMVDQFRNCVTRTAVSVVPDISAAVGANGPDASGLDSASVIRYVWLIWNGTTSAGLFSASATAPVMPSGYTHKRLVSFVRNNASSAILSFHQEDKVYFYDGDPYNDTRVVSNVGTQSTYTSVSCTSFVPTISQMAYFHGEMAFAAGTAGYILVRPVGSSVTYYMYLAYAFNGSAGAQYFGMCQLIPTNSSQAVEWRNNNVSGTTTSIWVSGCILKI